MSDRADKNADPKADPKEKFREALERKRGKQHPHEAASQNASKVQDSHASAATKREFRRKSGG